jgi:hypothetical protein
MLHGCHSWYAKYTDNICCEFQYREFVLFTARCPFGKRILLAKTVVEKGNCGFRRNRLHKNIITPTQNAQSAAQMTVVLVLWRDTSNKGEQTGRRRWEPLNLRGQWRDGVLEDVEGVRSGTRVGRVVLFEPSSHAKCYGSIWERRRTH